MQLQSADSPQCSVYKAEAGADQASKGAHPKEQKKKKKKSDSAASDRSEGRRGKRQVWRECNTQGRRNAPGAGEEGQGRGVTTVSR